MTRFDGSAKQQTAEQSACGPAPQLLHSTTLCRLKAAGFVGQRHGKGSHRQLVNPANGRVITVAVHTKKEVGTRRILKEAGL